MTRNEAIEKALRNAIKRQGFSNDELCDARAALALPEGSKVVNAELYGLAIKFADPAVRLAAVWPGTIRTKPELLRYFELREQSGDPLPYKVVRDGDKVRFE